MLFAENSYAPQSFMHFLPLCLIFVPPGLFGGFPVPVGSLCLLLGLLHGWPIWSTKGPAMHCPREGYPSPVIPGTRGVYAKITQGWKSNI